MSLHPSILCRQPDSEAAVVDAEPEASISEVVGEVPDASNINIIIRSEYNEVIYYYYISRSLHDQLTTELYRQVLYTTRLALTLPVRPLVQERVVDVSPSLGVLLVEVHHNHTGDALVTCLRGGKDLAFLTES